MFAEVCRLQRRAVYESLVEMLVAVGRAGEALTAAEKAKALMMTNLLSGQDIGATPTEWGLLRRETELGDVVRILRRRILNVSGEAHTGQLLERLKGIKAIYDELTQSVQGGKRKAPFPCLRSRNRSHRPATVYWIPIPRFFHTSRPIRASMYGPSTNI